MTYSPHTWQPGEIISSARLNALEQGVAAGGGSGYDLVLKVSEQDFVAEDVEVVSGSILDCEQKVANGEPVNAALIITSAWSYTPSFANAPNVEFVFPLTYWSCPYCWIVFSGIKPATTEQSSTFTVSAVNIGYDSEDGSIVFLNWPGKIIS